MARRNWVEIASGIFIPVVLAVGGWMWTQIADLKACEAGMESTLQQIEKRVERIEAKVDRLLERGK